MKWTATIRLKSAIYITVDNLISIDKKNINDKSIEKITDFKSFHLPKGILAFIGEKDLVTLNSNDIEFVQLSLN